MQAVLEHEMPDINATEYWLAFHEDAGDLSAEADRDGRNEDEAMLNAWCHIYVRYGLRVVCMRTEFYKMESEDLACYKLVMPTL